MNGSYRILRYEAVQLENPLKKVLQNDDCTRSDFITPCVPFGEMIPNFDSWLKRETAVIKAMVEVWRNPAQ